MIDQEKIHAQCLSEDPIERCKALKELTAEFSQLPDKQQAWNYLHELINNEDDFVRGFASKAICRAFSHIPNKQDAWDDLIKLSSDGCADVCYDAANALASAFPKMLDKEQAWNDLIKLSIGEDGYWGLYAYHTLGTVSIFKASQAEKEEDYKKELEKAIEFFEKGLENVKEDNPSQFCLPFYRSFHAIVFEKQYEKEEVEKYLKEAKDATKDSKSKELLFEAICNLSNALNEVQRLEGMDLKTVKGELRFYRQYCNRAAELMINTEEATPYATEVLRKGLPILDRNLKGLLEEIQTKARATCQVSKGTPTQEIACAVNREVKNWEIGSQEEMTQMIENLAYILKTKVANLPENEYVLNKIEAMKSERGLTKQYEILLFVIGQIPTLKVVSVEPVLEKIKEEGTKLSELPKRFFEKIKSYLP